MKVSGDLGLSPFKPFDFGVISIFIEQLLAYVIVVLVHIGHQHMYDLHNRKFFHPIVARNLQLYVRLPLPILLGAFQQLFGPRCFQVFSSENYDTSF